MTPRQTKALGKQIIILADLMGLRDWQFHLHDEPCDEGKVAVVSCVYGRSIANVWFCHEWWDLDASERHYALVHELVHVVQYRVYTYLDQTLPGLVGAGAATAIHEAVRQLEEHAVDQLATVLAKHLPVMAEP